MTRHAGAARSTARLLACAVGAVIVGSVALSRVDALRPAGPPDDRAQPSAAGGPSPAAQAVAARLGAMAAAGDHPIDGGEREALRQLYGPGPAEPLWIDASGAPTGDARDALAVLRTADADGLDPADYDSAALAGQLAALGRARLPDPRGVAAVDVALSAAVWRYFRHLHLGRIDPTRVGVRLTPEPERHDFVALLRSALTTHTLPATAAGLAPGWTQYAALQSALARYRELAATAGGPLPALAPARAGERHPAAAALRARLVALGDLPANGPSPVDEDAVDETLLDGVRRFQARHGLEPDGKVGPATRSALDVPIGRRIRQIELALERLRWLPDIGDERIIALNIPMFRLWTGSAVPDGERGPRMRVIVGRALRTQTPVFVAVLETVVFRPYWNVPRSILLKEILPAVERARDLAQWNDYEVVAAGDAGPARPIGLDAVEGLRAGRLRLRQRPGPANALGLVKFDFPNDADVYLHGTPAVALFRQARRDFSHGCIRVEDPTALAEWVLRDESGWDRARIEAAMAGPRSSSVRLSRPIRVVLFYTTAVVLPEDGTVHFAEDIYRHDATLEDALADLRESAASGPGRRAGGDRPSLGAS